MITLKQLAELSGLSVRTVGRALSGQGYVAPEKRELVQQLAKKYKYTPNLAARNLRLKNRRFVGIINGGFRLSANARKLSMLNWQLTANGYWPLLGCIKDTELCLTMLQEWAALAEYVVVLQENRPQILSLIAAEAEKLPIKFIFADCHNAPQGRSIRVDRAGSVCNMLEELDKMQFKHLVYCGIIDSRREGVDMARQKNLSMKISVIEAPPEFENGYFCGEKIMQSGADAVFFDTDRMAMGFYRYASENNIKIPDDISVIGFDDEVLASLTTPSLSTLAHPREKIAETVVKMIIDNCDEPTEPMPMNFIKRDSLKKTSAN